MTAVFHIGATNPLLRRALERRGLSVTELAVRECGTGGPPIDAPTRPGIVIIELDERTRAGLPAIVRALPAGSRIVTSGAVLDRGDRTLLLRLGIADALTGNDPEGLAEHVTFMGAASTMSTGSGAIAIFDDHVPHIGVLTAIAERFGYRATRIAGADALYTLLATDAPECVLLNLGVRGLDLGALIRRAHADPSLKHAPVIAYKSLEDGVFIHEIAAGLKKLCRVILSPEELYGFLVETLFRMELARAMCALTREASPESVLPYATVSLRQACRRFQGDLFPGGTLSSDRHAGSVMAQAIALQEAVRRVRGLRWMVPEARERPICGLGAGI